MSKVEIEVPEEVAQDVVSQMQNKAKRMKNVLQSYRSNDLVDCKHYTNLLAEREELLDEIQDINEQLQEQEDSDSESSDDLADLFG